MNRGDLLVERAAGKLEELAARAAVDGGLLGALAGDLAEDAAFLRRLKPSLVAARIRGEPAPEPAPARPLPEPPPAERKRSGPNPFLVAGIALAAGIVLAKIVDWRGHAHPRG